ncbi:HAD-IIIC family phosphatase [Actinomadura algeriensis]|uniref:FkbH-like protein n=1 Tax=Actinomadura algeriensis TaxID=1679523 RepID=A0ABR9JU34_9ACTN|nr:HAD-IIIC family phosphatase [Actinomadura algeriensis]MBE1533913.1 FkbH-like protein [Actinomadura algeriensis]
MDVDALLESLRTAVAEARPPGPASRLSLAAQTDAALVRRAGRVLAGLAPAEGGRLPVTILGTCTIGAYEHLLRAQLVAAGVVPELTTGDHGSFEMDLATGAYARAETPPRYVIALLDESFFVPREWTADDGALAEHVRGRLADLRALVRGAVERSSAMFVLHTVPLPAEIRDGLVSLPARTRVTRVWHELNAGILRLAEDHAQVEVVDLPGLLAEAPVAARDDRMHRYGGMPYTDGALLLLARQVRRIVQAGTGLSRKVLALDLDGTLWGGVLGEAGAEGVELGGLYPGNCYLALQRTVRRLREQGVVLVLASKNDPAPVDAALAEHPEMLLRPDAFAVRAVDWSAKSGNLRRAADVLGLSPSSMVFMDDSAFERAEVAGAVPEIAVVSASGDPAHLVRTLLAPGWFDTAALTDTDRRRADLYRARAERVGFATGFGAAEDFLRALRIEVEIAPATDFTVPRAAQLAARTNQFNLTGVRFDEAATAKLAASPEHLVATVAVTDRFGAEGVVGALWAAREERGWRVLNLVLSCRVLGRGIETAIAGWLTRRAAAAGAAAVVGGYVRSPRNAVAADYWTGCGFTAVPGGAGDGTEFVLPLGGAEDAPVAVPDWITLQDKERT